MNSDKGEKTCPLCAEEMDLTDQHFNPCQCGYQICVWCWHHIIEMAEKDKTHGLCPACRTPYDKDKIVAMNASCERLVAELNNDRKKSLKAAAAKPKAASEGRKDLNLTGVRVIQRNLVYVMSLPFDLADEDRFQRREYFGQYGKVVKVAMSRTQAGDIQLFPNDSCSVYITYSKEEEAIRCIRSVHQFVLDGRILKACFGTMKYCHAWLRNMPCNNAECLYLHEIGAPEDSFTKDETVSVHMRKIIHEITGAVANFPRRSGYMLPPPVDDFVDRHIPKCVPNNSQSVAKTSRPNSSNGRSVTLPAGALWGMHASSQSSVPNTPRSGEPLRDKAVTVSSGELLNSQSDFPEFSLVNRPQTSNNKTLVSANMDTTRAVSVPSTCTDFLEPTSQSCGDKKISRGIQSVCSNSVAVDADSVVDGYGRLSRSDSSDVDQASLKSSRTEVSRDSLQHLANEIREVRQLKKTGLTNTNEVVFPREEVNAGTALMSPLVTDISSFIRERLKDPEVFSCQPNKSGFLRTMQPSSSQYKADHDETKSLFGSSSAESRGINIASISHGEQQSNGNSRSEIDDRIANILSLDLDEYLTSSTHNLSKQLGAGDSEARSRKAASSCEFKNNQSRFSFARQDESKDQAFGSYNVFNQIPHSSSDLYKNSSEQQSSDLDMLGMYNGISSSYLKGMDHVTQNSTLHSSYKPPPVPRCPITAPPGFSVASRPPPPPGFASNGREHQTFNGFSGNHRYSDSPVYINPYHQSLPVENNGGVRDVQFMDPAIMAVGQGFENPSLDYRSNFQGNTNMFAKFQQQQAAVQSPLSSHQNCRLTDSFGMASRFIDQSQGSSSNILSRNMGLPNGQWDGLSNEIQSLNRLQNERFSGSTNRMMNGYNGSFRI
ncbi:general negative regulator of transcription subunit 4 isoform X2 [Raphanus sativus]|uniref:General negative regulator of transcription subunit 4 isoform X2 n=1 Tax=Raphanus sativus TaxID=3726 RepID=A0A9W3DN76_RAPSA|nr:general negative regulator of transcription subunit 4 isoform X2 [Raphanus sativus]